MFSDESPFYLWQNDRRVMIRRFRGERRNLEFAVGGHGGGTLGVMVWGSIGIGYRFPLVFIGGRLNTHRYAYR
jgi:hypothetical protein